MGIGEADAFSERLKQELVALEAANVYQLLQSEPVIEEVYSLLCGIKFLCNVNGFCYGINLPCGLHVT